MAHLAVLFRRTPPLTTKSSITYYSPIRSMATHQPEFNLKEYMAAKIILINPALNLAVPLRHPTTLHSSIRYSLLAPGKRICPIVTLASSHLVGGNDSAAMPVACATEMIHAMSLIHDDLPCMDDDNLRRGQPTNHVAFGEHTALLAGDALLALAFQHVAVQTVGVAAERVVRVVAELGHAAVGMAAGQAVDMECEGKDDVGIETLEFIHEYKTAKLVEAAAVCGVIIGGGSEEERERMRLYGRYVGVLFQAVDDMLDATRSSSELGKTAGKDVVSGKATYLKVVGMEKAREAVRTLVGKAEEVLAGFDEERAMPLVHLARFIASRLN